jgi:pimeloyl-ACP methyl ester carboxylesterase
MQVVADEGAGPVAVLLHGQPGDSSDFVLVRQALRGRGFRVLTVDRPGYSGRPAEATGYAGNARALTALLDAVAPGEAAYLLGLSWAGGAALEFARTQPARTAGLLLASSVGAPGSVVPSDRFTALPGVLRCSSFAYSHLAHLLAFSSGSTLTPAARAMTLAASDRWRANGGWRAYEVEQRALVAETGPLWQRLAPFPFPTTVVHGRRDRYVPVVSGRLLAGRLQARYVEVDAGHVLQLEVPDLLAAELASLRES